MPLTLAMTAPLLIVTHNKVSNHHLHHEWQLSKLIEKYGNFCCTKLCVMSFFLSHFADGRNRIGEVGIGCAIRLL
jgi:hypothetical protein